MSDHSKTLQNRLAWIDQTKGLAILGILLFHFFQTYPERNNLVLMLDRNGARLGYAAVDIFFVMAGFNTSYALASKLQKNKISLIKNNWKSWLIKRLTRIYPAYFLAVVVSLLLYYLFGEFQIKLGLKFVLSCVGIAGIRYQAINQGFWFFTVILEAYLVIPLIFYVCKSNIKNILLIGIILGLLTKIASFYFLNLNDPQAYLFLLQNNFLGSYIFQLCLGLYWGFIYAANQSFRKSDLIVAFSVFGIGLYIYIVFFLSSINIIYKLGFDIMFTPCFFILCQVFFKYVSDIWEQKFILGLVSLIGVYSYQIYLIHQPLYRVVLPELTATIELGDYSKILACMGITIILLILYVFLFTQVERLLRYLVEKLINNQT